MTPARVYKCALVTKGIIWLPPPRLVFSNTPALLNSLQCDTKSPCLRPPYGFQLRHDAFHKTAIQENTVIALLAFLNGQLAVEYLVSVFVLLQRFLCAFQFSITFLNGLRQFFLCYG